nr:unnamed protein product [Callosobruchus chinensis]
MFCYSRECNVPWIDKIRIFLPYDTLQDLSDPQSRYSSKLSLQEKKSNSDSLLEFGLKSNVAPLNHSAAHHRVAVKPKRTHGVPRRKKGQQLTSALPVTPEVNEDSSIRSVSPEGGLGVYKAWIRIRYCQPRLPN